eukprot:PhM_4_TR13191/c0_g4_i1/m.24814
MHQLHHVVAERGLLLQVLNNALGARTGERVAVVAPHVDEVVGAVAEDELAQERLVVLALNVDEHDLRRCERRLHRLGVGAGVEHVDETGDDDGLRERGRAEVLLVQGHVLDGVHGVLAHRGVVVVEERREEGDAGGAVEALREQRAAVGEVADVSKHANHGLQEPHAGTGGKRAQHRGEALHAEQALHGACGVRDIGAEHDVVGVELCDVAQRAGEVLHEACVVGLVRVLEKRDESGDAVGGDEGLLALNVVLARARDDVQRSRDDLAAVGVSERALDKHLEAVRHGVLGAAALGLRLCLEHAKHLAQHGDLTVAVLALGGRLEAVEEQTHWLAGCQALGVEAIGDLGAEEEGARVQCVVEHTVVKRGFHHHLQKRINAFFVYNKVQKL